VNILRKISLDLTAVWGEVMEREISAEAVRSLTFRKPPIGKRGNHEDEVDGYLQVIAAALDGRSHLSASDVHSVRFKQPPVGKRGYDEEEVDAFLDAIEDQLRAREGVVALIDRAQLIPGAMRGVSSYR
jgi:DivIVA domain-containing protein